MVVFYCCYGKLWSPSSSKLNRFLLWNSLKNLPLCNWMRGNCIIIFLERKPSTCRQHIGLFQILQQVLLLFKTLQRSCLDEFIRFNLFLEWFPAPLAFAIPSLACSGGNPFLIFSKMRASPDSRPVYTLVSPASFSCLSFWTDFHQRSFRPAN